MYKRWEHKYKNLPKLITNYDEFVEEFKAHELGKLRRMGRDELVRNLEVADQIWLFRERFGGYAHVLFYRGHFAREKRKEKKGNRTFDSPNHWVVHTTGNIGLTTWNGNSKIQKDRLEDVIAKDDKCFIV